MKRPSFQFYPADWRGSKWVSYDIFTGFPPRKPACYVIYLDGQLSYIGQASDVAKRLSSHGIRVGSSNCVHTKWGAFSGVVVKVRFGDRLGDWAMREIRLIDRIQPHLNCVGSVRLRS